MKLERSIPRWALPLQRPARYKAGRGGRGSGKSHFFAEEAVEAMVRDPNLRFVCIRETQRSLQFSAKALVESKIRALGVESLFEITLTEIRRIGGRGIMIFQGMQDHTAESIKSLEGFGRAWVEEAQSISQRSLDLLRPTIRLDGSEIWFSWNPDQPTDAVEQFFASQPNDSVVVTTTYLDNPWCPDIIRAEAAEMHEKDPDAYEHIYGAGYNLGRSGRVYSSFVNRAFPDGNLDDTIVDTGAELLVGMDFNVNPMSAVVAQRAGNECLVLDALEIPTSNTEEMAAELVRRYPPRPDGRGRLIPRRIVVCPDPAGRQRKTSAPVGQTDFTILSRAGFDVRAPMAAPPVVDRINNTNSMLGTKVADGKILRRCRIHPRATALRQSLANLVYKVTNSGERTSQPDKKHGYDHMTDALGYLLWEEFNVLDAGGTVGFSSFDPY